MLESALSTSAALARQTHAAEADLSAADLSAALHAAMASKGNSTAAGAHAPFKMRAHLGLWIGDDGVHGVTKQGYSGLLTST